MILAHSRMINNELLNKDPNVLPEQAPLIILDRKLAVCVSNNSKYTKHTRKNDKIIHYVRNGKK